jgi:multiple sugar transport system substrate-binding protein
MRRTHFVPAIVAAVALTASGCLGQDEPSDTQRNADAKDVSLTITANAVAGGKNTVGAEWIEQYIIPTFIEQQKAKGVNVAIKFEGNGASDEQYKQKVALDLKTGGGADVMNLDGIWVGEFAQAGYIRPLTEVAGADVETWDGWRQIPEAVQELGKFEDKRYAVPLGTDGRVLYFNKKLFAQAGLPADWQPATWDEVLAAGQRLKALPGVTPIQLNAGTAMGEATSMQGALPLLVGTGKEIYADGKWLGGGQALTDVLGVYQQIYAGGALGDPLLQQEAKGREKSFQLFAENKIGIMLEGDYLWRGVLEPTKGIAKMADRDAAVGWAKIPAARPGGGVRGQDFVSMSGGGVRVINPNSEFPRQAWELLQFMNSADAVKAELAGQARVTQREDVNAEVLAGDPLLSFIAEQVLPLTAYRPGLAEYPQVSAALQQATADIVAGRSPQEAAQKYQQAVAGAVGADMVTTG